MSDDEIDFLPLRVIRECSNGKRRYDPEGKRRLIEACLRPGFLFQRPLGIGEFERRYRRLRSDTDAQAAPQKVCR